MKVAQSCLTLCNPMDCSYQAPLSMEFLKPEWWSGQLFPSPGDLPYPGIEPRSPTLQADSLPSEPPGKPPYTLKELEKWRANWAKASRRQKVKIRGAINGGEGNGNPLQYPCLENPMDPRAWWAVQSMGSQRVGHDWATNTHTGKNKTYIEIKIKTMNIYVTVIQLKSWNIASSVNYTFVAFSNSLHHHHPFSGGNVVVLC